MAARFVRTPSAWVWSSCRAHLGRVPTPAWLDTEGLHGHLPAAPVRGAVDRRRAIAIYDEMLRGEADARLWAPWLRQKVFLGDPGFVERMTAQLPVATRRAAEVPRGQRARPQTLNQLMRAGATREQALHTAYTESGFTMTQLACELGLSVSRVSRLIAVQEGQGAKGKT